MKTFIINRNGVDAFGFSLDRETVRRKENGEYKEFRKNKFSKNTTDDFGAFHAFYDETDRLEAIEFFSDCCLSLDGKNLFELTFQELQVFMTEKDKSLDGAEGSVLSRKYGICISPQGSDDSSPISSVLVFRKGYFD